MATGRQVLGPLLLSVLLALPRSHARAVCPTSSEAHTNINGLKSFKINTAHATSFVADANWAAQAVILGASVWNEQANGGHFRFTGTTNITALEDSAGGTNCASTDYSLVRFDTSTCPAVAHSNAAAYTEARCGGSRFEIIVFKKFDNNSDGDCADAGETRTFGNGADVGGRDLAGLLAHEFGHTQELGHCDPTSLTDPEYCTMATNTRASATWRNPYEWDLNCSQEVTLKREVTGFDQTHDNTGFGGASAMSPSNILTKVNGGVTWDGGTAHWATSYLKRTGAGDTDWDPIWGESPTTGSSVTELTNPSHFNGGPFVPSVFREDQTIDRVFYTYWVDYPTQYVKSSVHRVRQIQSTNEFVNQDPDYLWRCNSMTGGVFLQCTDKTTVRSSWPLAVAWLATTQRAVVAWANHNNDGDGDDSESNRLKISVGYVDNDTLSEPTSSPSERSAVGPGLACHENFSSGYDCIIVFVDVTNMDNEVVARRFSVSASSTRYTLSWDSSTYVVYSGGRTANSITAWYNTNTAKFYLAYRTSNTNQKIYVHQSADATSWTLNTANLDDSVSGPSAASYFVGTNNLLMYAK